MMLEQVSLAAARMLENLTEKLELLELLELRSRARKTYRAMLDMAPRVGSSLLTTVAFLPWPGSWRTRPAWPASGRRSSAAGPGSFARAENIGANVKREKNKWKDVARHCACGESHPQLPVRFPAISE